jgi:hypothetical protein
MDVSPSGLLGGYLNDLVRFAPVKTVPSCRFLSNK